MARFPHPSERDIALGGRIRHARQAAGKKQEDLAAAMNVPRSTVSAIETGKRPVKALELQTIAEQTGVPLLALLDAHADNPLVTITAAHLVNCRMCGLVGVAADEQEAAREGDEHVGTMHAA